MEPGATQTTSGGLSHPPGTITTDPTEQTRIKIQLGAMKHRG
jgi:hypothetical protein